MASSFRCRIVTPTESVLDQDAKYVTFPAWDGQQGVMPGQSPFLSRLGVGSMRVDFPNGAARWYLVDGGFAQMQSDALTILTDRAAAAETLTVTEAEQELAAVTGKEATGGDRAALDRKQQSAREKLSLAKAAAGRGI